MNDYKTRLTPRVRAKGPDHRSRQFLVGAYSLLALSLTSIAYATFHWLPALLAAYACYLAPDVSPSCLSTTEGGYNVVTVIAVLLMLPACAVGIDAVALRRLASRPVQSRADSTYSPLMLVMSALAYRLALAGMLVFGAYAAIGLLGILAWVVTHDQPLWHSPGFSLTSGSLLGAVVGLGVVVALRVRVQFLRALSVKMPLGGW